MTRIPIRRALLSVWDKTGLRRARQGAARGRRGDRLHRQHRHGDRSGRASRSPGSRTSPASPSASTAGSRPCTRASTRACSRTRRTRTTAGSSPSSASSRSSSWCRRCTRSSRRWLPARSHDAIIEQIDIGGPAMVRAAAKNHGSVAVVTDIAQYGEVLKASPTAASPLEQRRRLAAQAYAHTAAYDAAVSSWFAASYAPDEIAQRDRLAGPGRPGVDPGRRAPLRREPAPAGGALHCEGFRGQGRPPMPEVSPGQAEHCPERTRLTPASPTPRSCTARPCPTTTTSTRTPRAARPSTSREPCVAIIKHSNPCGIAIGTNIADGARQGARVRPAVRLRRRDRGQQRGDRRDGRADHRRVRRGGDRAGLRPGGDGDPHREVEEHPAAALRRPAVRRASGMAAGGTAPFGIS